MVVAMLELVNPAWAWGLAATGLPVLAHLLSSRGGRLVAFPAVRFLQQAAADTARWLRPRHWLLMALRITAIAAIMLALTRPVWHGRTLAAAGRQGVAVAIVVDRSASMTRTDRGATLFDDARRRAIALLERLDPSRDVATVILLDDAPAALAPAPSANFAHLAARLEAVEPVLTHGDAAAAVSLARAELARLAPPEHGHRLPRVVIFSDMQASQWVSLPRDPTIPVGAYRIGREQPNLAVFAPSPLAARTVAGQPAAVSVQVGNFTPQAQDIAVVMTHDGDDTRKLVRLDAYAHGTVRFDFTPRVTGVAEIGFRIDHAGDALAADDQTGLFLDVVSARPVTLVTSAGVDDPATAAFFVSRALRADGSGLEVAMASPQESIGGEVDVAVLVEAGNVAIDEAMPETATVIQIVDSPDRIMTDRVKGVGSFRADSPVLEVFEGSSLQPLLDARFSRPSVADADAGEILIAFDDGSPLVSTSQLQQRRLVRIWADLSPAGTDFARGPAFAPLLHQLIRSLSPSHGGPSPNLHPTTRGDDPRLGLPGPLPDGRWVELAATESDLRTLGEEDAAPAREGETTATFVRGRELELWPLLLTASVLCLIAEPLVAGHRWGGRRDA